MALSVKWLFCLHEDLSSTSRNHIENPGTVVQSCHSRAGVAETRGPFGLAELMSPRMSQRSCLKTGNRLRNDLMSTSGLHTHVYTHNMHTHTYIKK